jgi:hypothetical protein
MVGRCRHRRLRRCRFCSQVVVVGVVRMARRRLPPRRFLGGLLGRVRRRRSRCSLTSLRLFFSYSYHLVATPLWSMISDMSYRVGYSLEKLQDTNSLRCYFFYHCRYLARCSSISYMVLFELVALDYPLLRVWSRRLLLLFVILGFSLLSFGFECGRCMTVSGERDD